MSTEAPAGLPVGRTDPATSGADALQPQRTDISFLSPSARTSFTRVDVGAENVEDDGSNGQSELEVEQQAADEQAEREPEIPLTPQVSLTFLLVTGRRRTMSFEPETTVGRAKELVWNAWPNEWQDERPPAPSYLRILYLGKMLQDDDTLTKVGFPSHIPASCSAQASDVAAANATVVHLSVRSIPPTGIKDAPKKKSIGRSNIEQGEDAETPGCCTGCVIA
ncbi:hypothetical protein PHLGIDRAFT_20517 [Phlebiopsis gigantea 11061_1 CR5-6]|uniref:Ubiquitin-like domain-containing protein n=1 Tax=Phlebiopsis gigantea (strain 11061_1 CR5-6) TaxID=745531 RepID=A0A0C3NCA8_PHLG1|nr:hypothetical protein PHLGIDRAFT_20517 [Phlebiopsis gigantea 11061_1 CR5-6]